MKAVAVGDLLLPASVFDETIRSASWVTAYDSFDWDVTKKRDKLRNVVRRMETGGSRAFLPTPEELERLKDAEVILSHLFTIPREVFEVAPKLRYILSARGGVENIDLKAAHEHGVSVIHCPANNAIAVAEYAIGLMIAESRNIARAARGLRSENIRIPQPFRSCAARTSASSALVRSAVWSPIGCRSSAQRSWSATRSSRQRLSQQPAANRSARRNCCAAVISSPCTGASVQATCRSSASRSCA